jgi:hypothetical protein
MRQKILPPRQHSNDADTSFMVRAQPSREKSRKRRRLIRYAERRLYRAVAAEQEMPSMRESCAERRR